MSKLPVGWQSATVEQICIVVMGQSPDSSTYNEYGEGLPFFQGKAEFGRLHPTVKKWCSDPKKVAELGDVLLSIRAPVGPSNIANEKCIIGRGLAALRAIEPIHQEYVFHLIRKLEPWLNQQGTGSTFKAVSGEFVRAIDVPIAPLNEQKRIADKLDAVLARVDVCRDRLDRIPVILKRFRQSVLAAATSGKLTEEWRGTLENIGWNTMSLAELCHSVSDGDHQAPPQAETGIAFITIAAINDGCLRLEKASRFVPASYFEALKESRRPRRGDILFSVTGSIGIPALVDTDNAFTFQRHIAILKPDCSKVSSLYLKFALGTESLKKQALAVATGTAQLTIPLTGLRSFQIDLPPKEEQTEIIRRVESLFSYADRLEARYTAARAQVEKLTPALLAKAFRGELVPQDPNDEPASELLVRIAASKSEAQPKKSASRQRKKPASVCCNAE